MQNVAGRIIIFSMTKQIFVGLNSYVECQSLVITNPRTCLETLKAGGLILYLSQDGVAMTRRCLSTKYGQRNTRSSRNRLRCHFRAAIDFAIFVFAASK